MPASQTLQNTNMDHAFGKSAWTQPTAIEVAILESVPTPTTPWASLVRATYTGYADVTTAPGDWNAASGGTLDNLNAITFPTATGGSSTVTHFAVRFGNTGEDYAWGTLTSSRTINANDTPEFQAGALITDVT